MSTQSQKVSFTVRRPSPVSRATSSGPESDSGFKIPALPRHLAANDSAPGSPLARSATSSPKPRGKPVSHYSAEPDSSDEENDELQDELVTGFDRFGVQRLKPRKKPEGPLIIPALQNRDWRELARRRRTAGQFVPASGAAETGKDGSVGGLGTRDTINSGPVLVGLQVNKTVKKEESDDGSYAMTDIQEERTTEVKMEEETEAQKALRAILAGVDGPEHDGPLIDIIPTPVSETDALKQDVEDLPESATLEDYSRVPVAQFGAALLRGMGWKEGTAASRKPGKGMVEPYLPEARPALLGIGAKEREVLDDGRPKKGGSKRPEKRYVPVIRKEREGSSGTGSGRDRDSRDDDYGRDKERRDNGRDRDRLEERTGSPRRGDSSRRSSRSPGRRSERYRDYDDRADDRRRDSERDSDRDRASSRRTDKDAERHRDRDRRRDRSPDASRRYR
ncbi:hypothetical protein HGRIS_002383 [Hohenbuehelia grisea]|uniref:G-patch domain-containing protein n=1 Tax=Hohenbuehelia grisea TaxID=104357 RepID=A0ABR3JL11_9AGAR